MQRMDSDSNWHAGHGHERKEMTVILSNCLLSEMQVRPVGCHEEVVLA